jgi:hypothetical protein
MARYTHLLTVAVSPSRLRQQLVETLETCHLEVVHVTPEYVMAREIPHTGITFPQLVTVEVLVDHTTASETETQCTFVIKNEELPLKSNNHCFQMYEKVSEALAENENWHLVKSTKT